MKKIIALAFLLTATHFAHALSWEDWRALNFTYEERGDLSVSGQLADPDNDGRSNLVEYASNTDPHIRDGSPSFAYWLDGSHRLNFSFLHRKDHPGIVYIPQITSNLRYQWQSGAGKLVQLSTVDIDTDYDTLSFRDDLAVGTSPGRFARLLIDNDVDGDGLPDAWEILNGLSPEDATDGLDDTDGDGRSNAQEFADGTDPLIADLPPGADHLPAAPESVLVQTNEDGSKVVTWQDTSDNETYFIIRDHRPDGSVVEIGRVGPGQTRLYIPAQR